MLLVSPSVARLASVAVLLSVASSTTNVVLWLLSAGWAVDGGAIVWSLRESVWLVLSPAVLL